MTHHPIRTLPDGTRVYSGYQRYKPLSREQRKYGVNKPDDPRAVRFHGSWYLPIEVLPDDERAMPETRADSDAYEHMPWPCDCHVCRRPAAAKWQRKWRRDNGLKA